MFLSRITRDEAKEKNKENQLNGRFEMPNCHSSKTAPCNDVYVVCTYLIDYTPAGE